MLFSKLLAVVPFMVTAYSKPLETRATSDFIIYAYGSGITGFPVISVNNSAYVTSYLPEKVGTGAHNVTFDAPATRGNFTASITDGGQSLFYVPSTSGPVGFTNTTDNSSLITTGFGFYGHVIYLQSSNSMMTKWYAIPTEDSKVWQLSWNDETDGVPVALRNIAPS